MTYEEAIRHIGLNANKFWTTVEDLAALQKAIEALEKQIPKQPYCDEYEECCCSNCDEILHLEDWDKPYCPHCGQALLWEYIECEEENK